MEKDNLNKKSFESVIIVVNWNGLDLLRNLLSALKKQTVNNFALLIFDNGSRDGSKEFLFQKTLDKKNPLPLWVLNGEENYGFALANNIAISFAFDFLETEEIILLNNDTLPTKNFIESLQSRAKHYFNLGNFDKLDKKRFPLLSQGKDWSVGSVAPLIENHFAKGKTDSAGILVSDDGNAINRGVGEKTEIFKKEEEIFGPTGAAVLYRKKALKDVALPPRKLAFITKVKNNNPFLWQVSVERETEKEESLPLPIKEFFSSRYFAYFEDVDLALRLRLRFWSSVFTPLAKINHYHSATGKSYSPFKSFHIHRNQYFNLIRDFPAGNLGIGFKKALSRYFLLAKSAQQKKGPASELIRNHGMVKTVGLVFKGWLSVLKNIFGLTKERLHIQNYRLIDEQEFKELLSLFKASKEKMIFETPDFLKGRKKTDAKNKARNRTKP